MKRVKQYWVKQYRVTGNILKWKLTDRIREDGFRDNRGTGGEKAKVEKEVPAVSLMFPDFKREQDYSLAPW